MSRYGGIDLTMKAPICIACRKAHGSRKCAQIKLVREVRLALHRMAKRGEVLDLGGGKWKLA